MGRRRSASISGEHLLIPTRFLLDTNIVSFLIKRSRPLLTQRFSSTPGEEVAVSSIVEAELRYGTRRLPPEANAHRLVDGFLADATILFWNSSCAQVYARLRVDLESRGEPIGSVDTFIAAHALALDLTLVTNDHAFARVPGLRVEDWTQG